MNEEIAPLFTWLLEGKTKAPQVTISLIATGYGTDDPLYGRRSVSYGDVLLWPSSFAGRPDTCTKIDTSGKVQIPAG